MSQSATVTNHRSAVRHLSTSDPVLRALIRRVGPCTLVPRVEEAYFPALARMIVYQQLSGRAAATIWSRVMLKFGATPPNARDLLALPEESLRSAGLSRQKTAYLRDLAERELSGVLHPLSDPQQLSDDEVIEILTRVKGIGRWTAHMYLMFNLGRPDVLPELDLGIRKAVKQLYRLRKLPGEKKLRSVAAPWSPYTTVACWYLWRSLDSVNAGS